LATKVTEPQLKKKFTEELVYVKSSRWPHNYVEQLLSWVILMQSLLVCVCDWAIWGH
jgi:hypothetical protein